jgi:hypothetical protein
MRSINAPVELPQKANEPVSFSDLKSKQADKITAIRESLILGGYVTLRTQAPVLGLSRSTAWHLLNGHYKASGLSVGMIKCILSSPTLPDRTHELIQEYVQEKLRGMYGHSRAPLTRFRKRMDASQ